MGKGDERDGAKYANAHDATDETDSATSEETTITLLRCSSAVEIKTPKNELSTAGDFSYAIW